MTEVNYFQGKVRLDHLEININAAVIFHSSSQSVCINQFESVCNQVKLSDDDDENYL